jgi:hypothetical protein
MSQQAKFKVGELVVVGKMNEEKWEPSFKPEECCFGVIRRTLSWVELYDTYVVYYDGRERWQDESLLRKIKKYDKKSKQT